MRRAGRATRYLIALSAVLMLALGGLFAHLAYTQTTVQDRIREDALWAVYQLDRETRMLSQAIALTAGRASVEAEAVAAMVLRYDILYSRLSILDNSKYAPFLETSRTFQDARNEVRGKVTGLEPIFNRMTEDGVAERAELDRIAATLTGLLRVTEEMLTSTNVSVAAARADSRSEVLVLQQLSAAVMLALICSIGLLIVNLMRQLRIVRSTSDRLERLAADISEAYRAAEAGNRAKSEFMATIGHEIRTPLNAILGMTELLSLGPLPAEAMEKVRVITSSGEALLEIINEILDFAKIEHGDFEPETVPFQPARLVREVAQVMDGRAAERRNRIAITVDGLHEGGWYLGDPARLRRVLLNLVSNAVKFTESGIVRVQVSELNGARLAFEVTDTGIGIAEEARHRLFNAFSQVDGTISRRYGGTGLGLAICKRVVEGLGGEIGVDSTVGVGSRFWFEVPAERTRMRAERTAEREALPCLDILVVEDNAINREVAQRFLQRLGQRVTLAPDGVEGVRLAAQRRFDLILMDMQMPEMDGIAATAAIRASGNAIPIIAMTANASEDDRRRCLAAGMDGFEAKPITLARLEALIRAHTSARPPRPAQANDPSDDQTGARVRELIEAVGEDGYRELLDSFFADAAALLGDLGRAMSSSDTVLADRSLHSLKGAAANLGFDALAELAELSRKSPLDQTTANHLASTIARANPHRIDKAA